MACFTEAKDVFSFTWQIENFSMCAQKRGEYLTSPVFAVDGLEKSSWHLMLYPRGEDNEYISLYLRRKAPVTQNSENKISVAYMLDIETVHSSRKPSKASIIHEFSAITGNGYGYPKLVKRSDILNDIHGDVLTVRCDMWLEYKTKPEQPEIVEGEDIELKGKEDSTVLRSLENIKDLDDIKEMLSATDRDLTAFECRFAPVECCARTQIKMQRMTIVCSLAKFCKEELNNKSFLTVMSTMNSPSFILTVEKKDDDDWMLIKIRRITNIKSQHFVKGKITVFESDKSSVIFEEDEYLFEAGVQDDDWQIKVFIKATEMSQLSLHCEFAISTLGKENHIYEENKIVVESKTNRLNIKTFGGLGNNFQDLYKCPNLPDVVLTCGQQIYHVHKTVLLAKSQGFKALLKNENLVDIEDLKPKVMNEMLMFMYNNYLEDLKENVFDLYFAAHKYQVESLKQECSSVLKLELTVSNVCKTLILANGCSDLDLFSAVQNFIQNNAIKVFESPEWLDLSDRNPKLALKMSQGILKHNMKI